MERLLPQFTESQKIEFVAAARLLLVANAGGPVKFRHQGRSIRGIDCIGTLQWSVAALGLPHADRTDYGRTPVNDKLSEAMRLHFGEPVASYPIRSFKDLAFADVITMDWGQTEHHVAIVTDHPEGLGMIHAYAKWGKVTEHRISDDMLPLITEVFRP